MSVLTTELYCFVNLKNAFNTVPQGNSINKISEQSKDNISCPLYLHPLCIVYFEDFTMQVAWREQIPGPTVGKHLSMQSDICGKMTIMALGWSFYFTLITTNYSRKMQMYFLPDDAEAFGQLKTGKQSEEAINRSSRRVSHNGTWLIILFHVDHHEQ